MRLLIPLLFLFACSSAQAALFADNEAREEIVKLRKHVKEDQEQRIASLEAKLAESERLRQTLEKRLTDLENADKARTVELLSQIGHLNDEVATLRGQLELNSHQLAQAQQRQRDLYADLDGRLRKLEAGPAPAAAQPGGDVGMGDPVPAPDNEAELKSYESAHELFKNGQYKEAADAFGKFLSDYPSGKYAPNALYWLGYTQFSLKDYKASMASQQKLIQQYPDNHKVPDAMYNIANNQIQLSDFDGAKQTLRKLLSDHPTSEVAPLAKKRLTVLESATVR